ncbi:GNAT family N-acetyltransferase [Cupriavidus sp. AU9028]|uniref:GNAT family N-acetyltransferase n=1 Tax=Cupriavidus sp. AU9028 TaxID=2871157 RepID=UPI001C962AC2|nr:GNAT family N-acetyltransferase [Cupriavidus sp. AU9028]MBY4895554.1 GNAT family N-acetyltransferase [Cupriavidus sp. AU9028]
MRLVDDLHAIPAADWDALLARQSHPTPFLRHAFLHALHASGSASAATGWQPRFLTLWQGAGGDGTAHPDADTAGTRLEIHLADGKKYRVEWDPTDPGAGGKVHHEGERLAAAMPLYAKDHSYGEYVFDWAWANAYAEHGLPYYPKWLSAVPFTPVQGNRLLADDDEVRTVLLHLALELARQSGLSSLHVLFPEASEAESMREAGMLLRHGVQFHWTNPGYADFEAFLATLSQKKRKNIRAERRRVAEAGIAFRHVAGHDIGEQEWRFFHRCYRQTYREHHSTPYLNLDFFQRIGAAMPQHLLMVIAEREGRPIAASLLVYDDDPRISTLYGRYWGALEHHPCLHFETAYYQPQQFCIERGIRTFEGGAQGEHKMARGFMPVSTRSAHWLAHPAFADAVERFLARERQGIDAYLDELNDRTPYREEER